MSKRRKKKQKQFSHPYLLPLVFSSLIIFIFFLLSHFSIPQDHKIAPPIPKPTVVSTDYLDQTRYKQLDQMLTTTAMKEDPRAALQQLTNLMNVDPKVYNSCHGLAHDIGHAAYNKYRDLVQAFSYQDDVCGSGYIHGVIEEYLGNTKNITQALYNICAVYSGKIGEGNCYHGVGHGIMFYTGNNVPQSTYFCDTYKNLTDRSRCSEGVFMENFNSEISFHPSQYLKPSDPMYPCRQEPEFHKSACYFYAPDYYLKLHEHDYLGAITWCQTAESGYILTCINGVGSRTMKQNIGSPTFAESICIHATTQEQINTCIDGMVSYYLVQYNSQQKAHDMCASLLPGHQQTCYNAIFRRNTMFAE